MESALAYLVLFSLAGVVHVDSACTDIVQCIDEVQKVSPSGSEQDMLAKYCPQLEVVKQCFVNAMQGCQNEQMLTMASKAMESFESAGAMCSGSGGKYDVGNGGQSQGGQSQGDCNYFVCMAELPQPKQGQMPDMAIYCPKLGGAIPCLEALLNKCQGQSLNDVKSSLLSLKQTHSAMCKGDRAKTCDIDALKKCSEKIPASMKQSQEQPTKINKEDCPAVKEVITCFKAVTCDMQGPQDSIMKVEPLYKRDCSEGADSSSNEQKDENNGAGLVFPSLLSVALAVFLTYLA